MKQNDSTDAQRFEGKDAGLSEVFALATGKEVSWSPEEFGAIFQYQLSAAWECELDYTDPNLTTRFRGLSQADRRAPGSLMELYDDAHPSLALLKLAKDFARTAQKHPLSAIPKPVAIVLYYLAIASARVRRGQRITRLSDEELRRGLRWALRQSWVTGKPKDLLAQCETMIQNRP